MTCHTNNKTADGRFLWCDGSVAVHIPVLHSTTATMVNIDLKTFPDTVQLMSVEVHISKMVVKTGQ